MSELTPVRRERIQSKITKLIFRDENSEMLDKLISVNELSETDAEEMIRIAKKARIDAIRSLSMKNVYLGCMIMMLGVVVVYCIVYLLGNLTKLNWALVGFMQLLGLGKMIQGVAGVILAPKKKGVVEQD